MKISRFEELEIWKEARELYKHVFLITSKEPFCNDFRFRDQIRVSSGSVSDNIAEGFDRGGNKEFVQFLSISKGSCGEVRSQSYREFGSNYIYEYPLTPKKILKRVSFLRKQESRRRYNGLTSSSTSWFRIKCGMSRKFMYYLGMIEDTHFILRKKNLMNCLTEQIVYQEK